MKSVMVDKTDFFTENVSNMKQRLENSCLLMLYDDD